MRHSIITCLVLLAYGLSAQTDKMALMASPPTNVERYGVDYELKNIRTPDPKVLAELDLDQYESLRQQTSDVEVNDAQNNVIIVLYALEKTMLKKSIRAEYINKVE